MMEDLDRMGNFLSGVYSTDTNRNILNLLLTPANQIDSNQTYLNLIDYYQSASIENQNNRFSLEI